MCRKNIDDMARILESAHNSVVLVDFTGRILLFNKAARALAGLAEIEINGSYLADFFPQCWPDVDQVMANGKPLIGKKLQLGTSSIIANISPIVEDGQVAGAFCLFQDILEIEKHIVEIQTYKLLNKELDVIINSSHDGLWISDAKGKTLRVNLASANFTGSRPDELIGKNMTELVDAGYFDRSATLEVLKHGSAVSFLQKQKNGRQLLVTGNPVYDENGAIYMVVVNARDLTALNLLRADLEVSRGLNRQYRREVSQLLNRYQIDYGLVIRSAAMRRVLDTALRVAEVDSTVLIQGDSGVGKGVFANVIHQASPRKDGPFIRVDCGGIPTSLIEAELFGYVKGAFTGALDNGKPGYFELANKGTLFLDEVGELPLKIQTRLLRFLDSNEVVRVGSTIPCKIDTRIIAATNRDLNQMVDSKEFRNDLFFRLSVVPLHLPSLQQRKEDILPLINHFLGIFNEKFSTKKNVSPAAADCLCDYHFPGNVRQLANLIEQLVVLATGDIIEMADLPVSIRKNRLSSCLSLCPGQWNLPEAVSKLERELIVEAMKTFGSQREAAKNLGINHSTLSRKIKTHGLHVAISQHVAICQ